MDKLKAHARERLGILHERGVSEARLYGVDDNILDGGLNSFFLLLDEPEVYNLPENPPRPSNNVVPASFWSIVAAMILGVDWVLFFLGSRIDVRQYPFVDPCIGCRAKSRSHRKLVVPQTIMERLAPQDFVERLATLTTGYTPDPEQRTTRANVL